MGDEIGCGSQLDVVLAPMGSEIEIGCRSQLDVVLAPMGSDIAGKAPASRPNGDVALWQRPQYDMGDLGTEGVEFLSI